jgi:26S proteasome regulatory subunit N1
MAQDKDATKATDKGKGKAVDSQADDKKNKDGQPQVNGKKDDEKIGGMWPNRLFSNRCARANKP